MKTLKLNSLLLILLLGFFSINGYGQSCLNFNNMTAPIVDYNNDSIYPIGSTLLTTGDIKMIKTKTGSWSSPGYFEQTTFNSVSSSQIFFHGYLTFDVSSASYSCRELSIDGTAEKIIIGNDTISTLPGFNPYNGNGYVIDTLAGGGYIITGIFNAVTIWIPTGLLNSACVNNCAVSASCIDYRNLIGTSWPGNTGYNNDSLYPAGSTILSAGGIKIIKTYTTGNWNPPYNTYFTASTDTTFDLNGHITLDVSTSTFNCKKLSFTSLYGRPSPFIVDGDTIPNTTSSYSGNGFTMNAVGNIFTVSGSFNSIILYAPNLGFGDICLESCAANNGCYDLNSSTFTDTPANYNNDGLYPVGAPFITLGDIKVIKTKTGAWMPGFQQSTINQINANDILYHGFITFDVSSANYSCRELTIKGFASIIIIGNDTINTTAGFAPYNGAGFVVDTVSGGYKITGNFNSVTLWAQTSIYSSMCLKSCVSSNTGCIDFRNLVGTSWPGGTGYNDDVLYPAGSTIISAGDVKIVKTHPYGNWNPPLVTYFAFGTDTTITGDGYMTIDVASSNYSCKQLNFSTIASTLIINGDTINNFGANSSYSGSGYNIVVTTSFYKDVVVTGNFNSVILAGPNLTIGNVCLDSCVTPIPCNNYAGFTFTITPNGVLFTNTSSSTSTSAQQFQWDFGDGNFSGDNDPIHNYAAPGTYYVCLTIVDFSCPTNPTFQFCDTVIIGGCPNGHRIITPNNDGEADDVFVPSGSKIYDRNGFMVKDVKQDVNWKGLDDSNQALPMGYYTITCGGGDGVFNVTIIR